jgi:hypothetical protein
MRGHGSPAAEPHAGAFPPATCPSWGRARRPWLLALVVMAGAAACGCSLRDRPGYNPYAPPGGDAPLLQRAEAALDVADDTLDDLDALMERAVY